MQLFIAEFEKKWDNIIVNNSEILAQLRKVLRMRIWDNIFVQHENVRYELQIYDWDQNTLYGHILGMVRCETLFSNRWLAIAMPNKREKVELIVQKLTEIGIKNIYFWPSERSIIRVWNEKKESRINCIAKEALEQSWWWHLPNISFEKDISKIIDWKDIVVFDKIDEKNKNYVFQDNTIWIIWPEWWLTAGDYQKFGNNIKKISLWDTVLRTETASILAWRILK